MSFNMVVKGIDVYSQKPKAVEIKQGIITSIRSIVNEENLPIISPAFIDIQVNGYRGNDYSAEDFSGEQMERIINHLAASGTTRHYPTLITGPGERIEKNLRIIDELLYNCPDLESAVPGIHIEGPYISSEDGPRGAHDPAYVRDPDIDEFFAWQKASGNRIALITLAPERLGALEFIKHISKSGVKVSLGHTMADPDTIYKAVEMGATLSTHLGNGSNGMIPRLKNYIWEQLSNDRLYASIITDGIHLPDSVIKTIWRTKGKKHLILTSDVAMMGGNPPGRYRWANIDVEVSEKGFLHLADTEYLAGAGHLLDRDIARLIIATGCSLAEAVSCCTQNPAEYFGFSENYHCLVPGSPAHLTLFQWKPGDLQITVEQTYRDGQLIFSR